MQARRHSNWEASTWGRILESVGSSLGSYLENLGADLSYLILIRQAANNQLSQAVATFSIATAFLNSIKPRRVLIWALLFKSMVVLR